MEKFWKIINAQKCHRGMKYKKGLNVDRLIFNPSGSCEPGGIYYAGKDILCFLNYGSYVSEVTLPEGEPVYQDPGTVEKFKAHRVILGPFHRLFHYRIAKLIEEGADVNAYNGRPLEKAISDNKMALVRLLVKHGARIDCRHIQTAMLGPRRILKYLIKHGSPLGVDDMRTLLHMVVVLDDIKIGKLLLKSGTIDLKALHGGVVVTSPRMKKLLLKYDPFFNVAF